MAQQAAARWPERVLGLIALDGFLLRPGQAVVDLLPPAIRAAWLKSPLVPPLPLDVLAIPPAHREWLAARLRPQPLPCFTETAPDLPPYAGPRHYLRATGFAFPPFDRLAARAAREGWRVEEIAAGHDMMLDDPVGLAHWLSALTSAPPDAAAPAAPQTPAKPVAAPTPQPDSTG